MGASRMAFNLFSKIGRENFIWEIKRNHRIPSIFWKDTFGKYVCKIIGHTETTFESDGSKYCYRCFHKIK